MDFWTQFFIKLLDLDMLTPDTKFYTLSPELGPGSSKSRKKHKSSEYKPFLFDAQTAFFGEAPTQGRLCVPVSLALFTTLLANPPAEGVTAGEPRSAPGRGRPSCFLHSDKTDSQLSQPAPESCPEMPRWPTFKKTWLCSLPQPSLKSMLRVPPTQAWTTGPNV